MPIVRIEDHTAQAEALLLEQYQGKPRIRSLLFSFIRRCQELENAAWDVIVQRLIDNAMGAQLPVRVLSGSFTLAGGRTYQFQVETSGGVGDDKFGSLQSANLLGA